MHLRKVILFVSGALEQDIQLIDFALKNFKYCLFDVVVIGEQNGIKVDRFFKHLKGRISQRFQSMHYYAQSKLRFVQLKAYRFNDVAPLLKYHDLILSSDDTFSQYKASIIDYRSKHLQMFIPVIYVRPSHSAIRNIIFIDDGINDTVGTLKKFCYLLTDYCQQKEAVLLIKSRNDDASTYEERKKLEYLLTKCKHLAVHKIEGEVTDRDLKMIDYQTDSLIVDLAQKKEEEQAFEYLLTLVGKNKNAKFTLL